MSDNLPYKIIDTSNLSLFYNILKEKELDNIEKELDDIRYKAEIGAGFGDDITKLAANVDQLKTFVDYLNTTNKNLAAVAKSGDYDDLLNTPENIDSDTINSLVDNSIISDVNDRDSIEFNDLVTGVKINGITILPESGIVELGVTGNYNKPSTGIPLSDLDSNIQSTLNEVNNIKNNIEKIYYIEEYSYLDEVYPLNTGIYILKSNGMIILQSYDNLSKCVYQLRFNIISQLLERRYQAISDTNNKTISTSWTSWSTNYFASTIVQHVKDAIDNNTLVTSGYKIVENIDTQILTVTINPNKMYIFGIVDSLTISFDDNINSLYNGTKEYLFQFDSGETPTRLALPADIKWVNGEFPVIEANYTYQISVLNNCASIMKFKTV